MDLWDDEACSLAPKKSNDAWDSGGIAKTLRHSLRASNPLSLTDLDMWDSKSHFKTQSAAWCSVSSVTGAGFLSKLSTSSTGSSGGFRQDEPGLRRWHSMSRMAPEGAPRSLSPSPGGELRAALAESSFRRTELVQRLREAHERLDSQTDLLRSKDTQLHHTGTTSQLLELKHKQLAEAVCALEREKEAAELSRFEESRRRGELQDKVLQLEMDMLKMRSNLERGGITQPASIHRNPTPLNRTLPVTQDDFYREGKQKAERELSRLREALREAEEKVESLETERDQAVHQLHSSKEAQRAVLSQTEEVNQRLSHSIQSQSDLQEQLSEARSKLGQAALERDLLTTKALRLEDSVDDLKARLSAALTDKDRLVQEKADLHRRDQGLELELERALRGREGFTDQVCELHQQLAEATASACRRGQETVQLKEELLSVGEANEKLTIELQMVKLNLEASLTQQHDLAAERIIHTNQIAALETERSQLIGEKEELLSSFYQGEPEELTALRDRYDQLREFQDALESENQTLQERCQSLEAELRVTEEELQQKEAELRETEEELQQKEAELRGAEEELQQKEAERQKTEAETARSVAELRGEASHWREKWEAVALKLRSTQEELEGLEQKSNSVDKLQEEADRLTAEVEKLQAESQKDRDQIQTLLQLKASAEAELARVKKEAGGLLRVELDACRQQLELEESRSQGLLYQLSGRGQDGEVVQTLDRATETEPSILSETPESFPLWQKTPDSSSGPNISQSMRTVSLEQVDGELGQVKVELQKVWEMLRDRDSELEEQNQELQLARRQMNQQGGDVERLELELAEREQDLQEQEHSLKSMERLRDAERTEAQIKISALELKLVSQRDQSAGDSQRDEDPGDILTSLRAQLEESSRRASQLQQERDRAVQRLQTLRQLHQGREGKPPLDGKKEKTVSLDRKDPEQQRRLVTEQLKSLFKEREQLGLAGDRSGTEGGGDPLQGDAANVVKQNTLDALQGQRRRQQEPQRHRGHQQGAALGPVSEEQEEEEEQEEQEEAREEEAHQRGEELQGQGSVMSAMSLEISNLKGKNDNLLKAELSFQQQLAAARHAGRTPEPGVPSQSDSTIEWNVQGGTPLLCEDGIYLAQQVDIYSSPEEEEEEEEKGVGTT